MTRYFFDIHDGDRITVDVEGLELPDIEAAQEEAALSLAEMIRNRLWDEPVVRMAIHVRDAGGLIVEARFFWEMRHIRQ